MNAGGGPRAARLGLLSIGLEAYWPQFPELRRLLEGYTGRIAERLGSWGEVVATGMVDTPLRAREAAEELGRARLDLLFVHTATYATSAQVLPVAQAAGASVVVLNLQPEAALDYERVTTAEWLASCSACCVPELCCALERAAIPFHVVSGTLDDEAAWRSIEGWSRAAGVAAAIRRARFGFLGHAYPGMLDMYTDFTAVQAQLGSHVEVLEIDDLVQRAEAATDDEVTREVGEIGDAFALAEPAHDPIAAPLGPEDLRISARVSVGLASLVRDFELDGLAYYHRGLDGSASERAMAAAIVGASRLTAAGVPCAGEADLKNAIAMLIMDRLGAGGSFTEFYAMDFRESFVLMGHDGPAHLGIADGRPVVRKLRLYHGKSGLGVSVECKVRLGPVTILGLTQGRDGRLRLLCAEGESIPGSTFRIGNTNSRIRFPMGPGEFVTSWSEQGPTHHVALGVGHHADDIARVAELIGVDLVRVA
ncbi:MAG TPA: L-fucose/L-arabinose isomerase family protein [Candidatus Dormibacteraeota bacterium]|nr:L-fucose/L-arabinose isomerase family protein [Candidatus Dormibacteraeota bacterium]